MTTLPKRFFPVIHCVSPFTKQGTGHALLNSQIAFRGGADGVFFIGHNMPYTEGLFMACQNALNYVDTVATSGDKSGSPPDVAKVQAMREAIRPHDSLALASGVSVENVALFKPYVDTFLVASSITERRADRGGQEYLV